MEIDPLFKEYIKKAENITPEEALDTLIKLYINACGISLGERTVAKYAANYWMLLYKYAPPNCRRTLTSKASWHYVLENTGMIKNESMSIVQEVVTLVSFSV